MKRVIAMAALILATAGFVIPAAFTQDKPEIKVVKYPELGQLVRQHLGKVVVVDFWTTT